MVHWEENSKKWIQIILDKNLKENVVVTKSLGIE